MHAYKRHWMRHTAVVPKGFVRCQVLESLNKKPMSGSEIMSEIETRTDGHWKPSPGSIYPLLAWLQDNGHIKELPSQEGGLRRYELTNSGRKLLEEQKEIMENQRREFKEAREGYFGFGKHGKFLGPPFAGSPWFNIPPEKIQELRGSVRKLMSSVFEMGSHLADEYSEETVDEAKKILDETADRFEQINKKLRISKGK